MAKRKRRDALSRSAGSIARRRGPAAADDARGSSGSHVPGGAGVRRWLARPSVALAIPLFLAIVAYARVLHGEFQFDDQTSIERRLAVKDLGAFIHNNLVGDFGQRPIADLTFALNYAVGGLVPWNFHVTNLVIHLLAVVLVFAFTRAVLRLAGAASADWVAVAVAGVFALHPIQSEAVSYIVQRAESLASALYVATLLLILAAERRGLTMRGAPFWIAAFGCYVAGLGAKAIVITMPVAWFLLVAVVPAPERRSGLLTWRLRALAVAPFVVLDLVLARIALAGTVGSSHVGFSIPGLSASSYFLTQLRVMVVYLRLLFWPSGQTVDWDFPISHAIDAGVAVSGAILLALAGGAVWAAIALRNRGGPAAAAARVAAYGVLWFFLVLSVTSSFVPLADALVEHRLYLASWGIFVAVGVGVERALARIPPNRAVAAAAGIIALTWAAPAAALYRRNAAWESQRALWTSVLEKSPCNARAHLSVGFTYRQERRYPEAIAEYQKGLECAEGRVGLEMQLLRNLGAALIWSGRFAEATDVLERADAKAPYDSEVLTNLAVSWLGRKDMGKARAAATRALAVATDPGPALNVLGLVQMAEGDLPGARASFERAVAADPDVGPRSNNLGNVLEKQGDVPGACAAWRHALSVRLDEGTRREVASSLARRCGTAAAAR